MNRACLPSLLALAALPLLAQTKTPAFTPQVVDSQIEIGYGLAIADVQGDGRPDILLADKRQFVWYEAPSWKKHVLAENLTEKDNVCIAARDIDGDGKCEIAVGAEWNPSDTVKSGAVFYLIPPADRTQRWEAVKFPEVEPTTHRMRWVKRGGKDHVLVVVPLHGRGNDKDGNGEGVRVLAYRKPSDARGTWEAELICDDMHKMHNLDVVADPESKAESLLLGGREGIRSATPHPDGWKVAWAVDHLNVPNTKGVGELRAGSLGKAGSIIATIEPMHGTDVIYYSEGRAPGELPGRHILDTSLEDGHAILSADFLAAGMDQVVVGWRANASKLAKVGIKMFVPEDAEGLRWGAYLIDDNTMACEDLALADLDGNGKIDIIAAGRRTKNVKVYWNQSK